MGPIFSRRFVPLDFHCLFLALFFALVISPKIAQAHLVTSGAGPFFDGVAHFFVSLDDLLVVVAFSLLSGLLGKTAARGLVLVLPLAWFVGMVLGLSLADWIDGSGWATSFTLLVGGLLLSLSPKLPTWGIVTVAGLIGLLHGSWNGAAMRATETSAIASLGIVTAAGIVALVLSATAVSVKQSWQRIALRVIGSWVAAFGLLALAWHFRANV
jgi:hydrogenase/urease accessory protein HupE